MTRKIHILHIQTGDGTSGGVANYISTLIKTACYQKYQNIVVVPSLMLGADAHTLYQNAICISAPSTYSIRSIYSFYRQLKAIVKKHQIEVIHAHALRSGFICSIISMRLKKYFLYTNHGLRYTQKNNFISRAIFFHLEKFVCSVAHKTIAIRSYDFDILNNIFPKYKEKFVCIPTQLQDPFANHSVIKSTEKIIISGVGSLIPIKNPHKFIQWISITKNLGIPYEAHWIGDGPMRFALENVSMENQLHIKWHGHLPKGELMNILRNTSVMLLTSIYESFPLAVLEAYANHTPVISSDFSGVESFIDDHKTGVIVRSNSAIYFSEIISDLYKNKSKLETLSTNARKLFLTKFSSPEHMAKQYSSLINK